MTRQLMKIDIDRERRHYRAMTRFLDVQPTTENRWRALILLGRNTASYKFALANALLEIDKSSGDLVRLEDLARPFAKSLSKHMEQAPKQGATNINKPLREACAGFNAGIVNEDELVEAAVRHGFGHVIDAFHVLGGTSITERFFVDERRENNGIRLTDEIYALGELTQLDDLAAETEARWRIVETGWELGVNPGLIEYDQSSGNLSLRTADRRVALRSCLSTLNGYQKGKCFYCFGPISTEEGSLEAEVDHFFPWARRDEFTLANGIWNLVLACQECNRGTGGKFDRVPEKSILERLHRRNEFYVESKHTLADTIRQQTGKSEVSRQAFLQATYRDLVLKSILMWRPPIYRGAPSF